MNKLKCPDPFVGGLSSLPNPDKDEMYRPYLIHPTTSLILTEQIMTLMPAERNIILTMNEYCLTELNPSHPTTPDSPTHIIMFCIRFLSDGLFQPIGALLIYKYENQSKILAECLKAYINDLWKIGLYVIATVSPPFETFKGILNHLVNIPNLNYYAGVISYSVAPFKEIIHLYDVQFLLIKLQNLFKEGDIVFEECCFENKRHYRASWTDIAYVLTSSAEFKLLSAYLAFNEAEPRRIHIFSEQIYTQLMQAEAQGELSQYASGCLVLLNCVRTFLKYMEQDLVDVKRMTEIHYWDGLIGILQHMQFQKSKNRTCTKESPFNNIHVLKNPMIRRKIDFENKTQHGMEEKTQSGKSKSRKKRKKLAKPNGEIQKSGKDLREQALSKILSDDTTVTVHFFNGFEPLRSQADSCDIDKNNNSSSDDSSKMKPPQKTSKKKSKSKIQHHNGTTEIEHEENSATKLPKISLREFSRLSAEEENVLNNENVFNSSKQNILNNENFKDVPTSGGCLKKSITDILNSLNNVKFHTNINTKNTNVHKETNLESEAKVITESRDSATKESRDSVKESRDLSSSPSGNYLLNNKTKSYGSVEWSNKANPFALVQDLGKLSLNESDSSNSISSKSESSPLKSKNQNNSSLSELILSGADLGGSNLGKYGLNRPNLSNFDSSESDKSINMLSDLILSGSDLSTTKFDSNKPNLSYNETDLSMSNKGCKLSDSSVYNFNNSYSNFAFNLNGHDTLDGGKKSNLEKSGISQLECDDGVSKFDNCSGNFQFNVSKPNSSSFCESLDFSKDHFCSKSDEETENSIKASCDNVPNILELLDTEKSPSRYDTSDFEENPVSFELLSTIHGTERLFKLLYGRRVRVAKPDSFIVEHIDFLATIIREKNGLSTPSYVGKNYALFNSELAISTLQTNIGLYLVSKE